MFKKKAGTRLKKSEANCIFQGIKIKQPKLNVGGNETLSGRENKAMKLTKGEIDRWFDTSALSMQEFYKRLFERNRWSRNTRANDVSSQDSDVEHCGGSANNNDAPLSIPLN